MIFIQLGLAILTVLSAIGIADNVMESIFKKTTYRKVDIDLRFLPSFLLKRKRENEFFYKDEKYKYEIIRDGGEMKIEGWKKKKLLFSMKIDSHNKTRFINKPQVSDKMMRLLANDPIQMDENWINAMKDRIDRAESEYQKIVDEYTIPSLKKQWEDFSRKQEQSFWDLMWQLEKIDRREKNIMLANEHFKAKVTRLRDVWIYEINFKNGISLFKGGIINNTITSNTFIHSHKNYIKEKKMEKVQEILNGHLEDVKGIKKKQIFVIDSADDENDKVTEEVLKEIGFGKTEKHGDVFDEIYTAMNEMKQEKEYLSEEEIHLLTYTFPNDLKNINSIYYKLNEKHKESEKEKIEDIKKQIKHRLEEIKEEIEKRKIKQLDHRIKLVKLRER